MSWAVWAQSEKGNWDAEAARTKWRLVNWSVVDLLEQLWLAAHGGRWYPCMLIIVPRYWQQHWCLILNIWWSTQKPVRFYPLALVSCLNFVFKSNARRFCREMSFESDKHFLSIDWVLVVTNESPIWQLSLTFSCMLVMDKTVFCQHIERCCG